MTLNEIAAEVASADVGAVAINEYRAVIGALHAEYLNLLTIVDDLQAGRVPSERLVHEIKGRSGGNINRNAWRWTGEAVEWRTA